MLGVSLSPRVVAISCASVTWICESESVEVGRFNSTALGSLLVCPGECHLFDS